MIRARHDGWAEILFRLYIQRLTRRGFHALRLIGEPAHLPAGIPVLLTANHSTWWDGFFVCHLNWLFFRRRLYMMMLEEQLARYPFFSRVGAFGVRPGHPRSVAESLDYSASLLKDPGAMLCVFPQGELVPHGRRPVSYQRGLERILQRQGGPVTLLPLAMRCEQGGERLPDAFFLMGSPQPAGGKESPRADTMAREQEQLMQRLDAAIAAGDGGRVFLGTGSREAGQREPLTAEAAV
jgi:1-acyl-sn-glycerol-3-phosphate acyltransferase